MNEPKALRDVLLHGDSRELLKTLPDCSVDSLVTDPPAGIAFMAKEWDDPDAWKYPISKHGFTDGGDRVPAPTIGSSSRNPNCRVCKRHKRGWKDVPGCECEKPEFDTLDNRLADRDAFIAFLREIMQECFRVLKPGGHGLIWSIPRTSHWTATAIEEAGFEIRDTISHCFGSGFPKSLNIGKALDKQAGAERGVVGKGEAGAAFHYGNPGEGGFGGTAAQEGGVPSTSWDVTAPATDDAKKWDGWGTSLKPAVETWWLVRKPIEQQNVASQVLKTGTGAINIDASRVHSGPSVGGQVSGANAFGQDSGWNAHENRPTEIDRSMAQGRWPANLVLSHSPNCQRVGTQTVKAPVINRFDDGMKPFGEGAGHPYTSTGGGTEEQPVFECEENCPVKKLDEQSGQTTSGAMKQEVEGYEGDSATPFLRGRSGPSNQHGDAGGASRFFQNFEPQYEVPFFYTGKASKRDKNADLDETYQAPMMELREDITEEERQYVFAELRAAGVEF